VCASRAWTDTHLQVWDQGYLDYPWLSTRTDLPIVSELPTEFEITAAGARQVVLVEAGAPGHTRFAELGWLSGIALGRQDVLGVIAAVDWNHPTGVDLVASHDAVVGVRINLTAVESQGGEDILSLAATFSAAAERDLAVDILCSAQQFGLLEAALARGRHGEVVIGHLGNPPLKEGVNSAAGAVWVAAMQGLAAVPRRSMKLSGGATDPRVRPAGVSFCRKALELFPPKSITLGTDWPVSSGAVTQKYGQNLNEVLDILGNDVGGDALSRNAQRIYARRTMRVAERSEQWR